jgi:FKBP-type peptidyl-prolyl cis-trans isomerase FkpA
VESLNFAASLDVDFSRMTRDGSGLYYEDLEVGSGEEARRERRVTVHFSGWLHDGTPFGASRQTGSPLTFTIGEREVIRGWEEGVKGMRVGGRRKLVVPPRLGYGSQPRGEIIPGNATLVFVVELVDVEW